MNKLAHYSWILPIYNETESLPQLLLEISTAMKGKSYEILGINDGSTDETALVLNKLSKKYPLKVVNLKKRMGKWEALRVGFSKAAGEIIITSDSDLQDDPLEVTKLLKKMKDSDLEIVSGLRTSRNDIFYKIYLSNLGNILVSSLYKYKFYDLNSPFKIYKKEALRLLPKEGSLFRFSLLFAHKMGITFKEIPINHRKRIYGKSKFGIVKYFRIIFDLILVLLLFSGSGRLTQEK